MRPIQAIDKDYLVGVLSTPLQFHLSSGDDLRIVGGAPGAGLETSAFHVSGVWEAPQRADSGRPLAERGRYNDLAMGARPCAPTLGCSLSLRSSGRVCVSVGTHLR